MGRLQGRMPRFLETEKPGCGYTAALDCMVKALGDFRCASECHRNQEREGRKVFATLQVRWCW